MRGLRTSIPETTPDPVCRNFRRFMCPSFEKKYLGSADFQRVSPVCFGRGQCPDQSIPRRLLSDGWWWHAVFAFFFMGGFCFCFCFCSACHIHLGLKPGPFDRALLPRINVCLF